MFYERTFREAMVQKILSAPHKSIREISQETGVSKSALYGWKKRLAKTGSEALNHTQRMPRQWQRAEKLDALLESAKLSEPELGRWLRAKGVRSEHLKQWEVELKEMKSPKEKQELRDARKRIKELERELLRKDKALAEVSALLVLKKKANILLSGEEDK